ncbi:MAG: RIP metalloprotease RseP [Steroidobacteraceae bacterium]
MQLIWYLLWFVIAVSLLVTVHEFGHYWVARRLGFKVLRFSVGFGRPLLTRIAGADRTEYVFAALPLGGYVKLLDEREGPVPSADLARSFTRKPPWQRILVLLAGPAFNIAFAILVLWGLLWAVGSPDIRAVVGDVRGDSFAALAGLRSGDEILAVGGHEVQGQSDVVIGLVDAMSGDGRLQLQVRGGDGVQRSLQLQVEDPQVRRSLTEPSALLRGLGLRFWEPPQPAVVGKVLPGGPAERAGLRAGDRILAVEGVPVASFPDLVAAISAQPGREVLLEYQRGAERIRVRVLTEADEVDGRKVGRIRVETPARGTMPARMIVNRSFGPLEALVYAAQRSWDMTVLQARMFGRMIVGQVSLKNLSGPISIAEYAGESARGGVVAFLGFLVLISLSLGFLNLLPIPILDGGQILYQIAEWVKGSPLSERAQAFGQQLGIALLLLLMGVALFNDVARQLG